MDQRKLISNFIICLSLTVSLSTFGKTLSVMSYNVQNLFDTKHDDGKNDYEFLPNSNKQKKKGCKSLKNSWYKKSCKKTNWTDEKLALKIKQIKKVVKHAGFPDILGLIEVENENVVSQLASGLGYDGIVTGNGLDKRGVDVALLYKKNSYFNFVSYKEVKIENTRSLLQVTFSKKKKRYHFFINHWPSQGSSSKRRLEVAQRLRSHLDKINKKDFVVMMGDFNTLDTDSPHPFRKGLNYDNRYMDLTDTIVKGNLSGTYFYTRKMAWSYFDRIFISKNLKKKFSNYKIIAPNFLTGAFEYRRKNSPYYGSRVVGIPKRYDFSAKRLDRLGFSDHFAVKVDLDI
jgi:predicted extracellular nuclease